MFAQHLQRLSRAAIARAATAIGGFGKFDNRSIHAGFKDVHGRLQPRIFALMRQIGSITADAGGNRLSAFGVVADRAWQGQQFDCPIEPEIFRRNILGDRGTRSFLALAHFYIGAETT